jgi:hypothetical protein
MTFTLTLAVELALSVLLAATLVYCSVLEHRLRAVRRGQEHLKSTIDDLNNSIATAGASLRALQAAAGTVGETLDRKLSVARATIDELSLLTVSGERIASRMERSVDTAPKARSIDPAPKARSMEPAPKVQSIAQGLPSGSIMDRLKVAK